MRKNSLIFLLGNTIVKVDQQVHKQIRLFLFFSFLFPLSLPQMIDESQISCEIFLSQTIDEKTKAKFH